MCHFRRFTQQPKCSFVGSTLDHCNLHKGFSTSGLQGYSNKFLLWNGLIQFLWNYLGVIWMHLVLSWNTFQMLLAVSSINYLIFWRHCPLQWRLPLILDVEFNLSLPWFANAECALQDPSTSSARHARLHICSSFIRISKAVDRSILPHMKVSYSSCNPTG